MILSVRLGADILGIWIGQAPVDQFQQQHLDEIMMLNETTDRQRRSDHQHRIAGLRIDQGVPRPGLADAPDVGQRQGSVILRVTTAAVCGDASLSAKVERASARRPFSSPVQRRRLRARISERIRIACPFLPSATRLTSAIRPRPAADRVDLIGCCESNPTAPSRHDEIGRCASPRQTQTSRAARRLAPGITIQGSRRPAAAWPAAAPGLLVALDCLAIVPAAQVAAAKPRRQRAFSSEPQPWGRRLLSRLHDCTERWRGADFGALIGLDLDLACSANVCESAARSRWRRTHISAGGRAVQQARSAPGRLPRETSASRALAAAAAGKQTSIM